MQISDAGYVFVPISDLVDVESKGTFVFKDSKHMYDVLVYVKTISKQEKLLLKFDSILAALGVCDQVILKASSLQTSKGSFGALPE